MFYLKREANQLWQWLSQAFREEDWEVTWIIFQEELQARFEHTICVRTSMSIIEVKQIGSLRDYQKKFEWLGSRVQGWTWKVLVEHLLMEGA